MVELLVAVLRAVFGLFMPVLAPIVVSVFAVVAVARASVLAHALVQRSQLLLS